MANIQTSFKKIFTKIEDNRNVERKDLLDKPKFFFNIEKFTKNLKKIAKSFELKKLMDKGKII